TGRVTIDRYVVAEDCGRMINPAIVEGQVMGGVAQGIATALYEQLVYSPEGQLLSGSFMDYVLPTAPDVPAIVIRHLETPSNNHELGTKGTGEGGTIGATACVANAVANALAAGVTRLPLTPDRLLHALRDRRQPAQLTERDP